MTSKPTRTVKTAFLVPYPRTRYARIHELWLESLQERLRDNQSNLYNPRIALIGPGSLKTRIALEYVFMYKSEYSFVFWINGQNREELLSGFREIAEETGCIQGVLSQTLQEIAESVVEWLGCAGNWLLVIENLDNINVVDGYLPITTGSGQILITAQNTSFDHTDDLEIKTWGLEDAEQFVLGRGGLSKAIKLLDNVSSTAIISCAASIRRIVPGILVLAILITLILAGLRVQHRWQHRRPGSRRQTLSELETENSKANRGQSRYLLSRRSRLLIGALHNNDGEYVLEKISCDEEIDVRSNVNQHSIFVDNNGQSSSWRFGNGIFSGWSNKSNSHETPVQSTKEMKFGTDCELKTFTVAKG